MSSTPGSGIYCFSVFSNKKWDMAMPSVTMAVAAGRGSLALCRQEKTSEFNGITRFRSGRTVVRRTCPEEIRLLLDTAQGAIGGVLASEAAVRRVAAQHPDALWTFIRNGRAVGCLAMLMLNEAGLEALLAEIIDFRDPAPSWLCNPAVPPAAIYVWGLMASPLAVDGVAEVILRLNASGYHLADIYAFQATEQGAGLMRRLGFGPLPGFSRKLFRYIRLANRSH